MAIIHTNKSLREAVALYLCDKENAIEMYGPINTWNTSEVTNMCALFENSCFNEDISDWDVSKVNNLSFMFRNTPSFNQDLSKWKPAVSHRHQVGYMFANAMSFDQHFCNWPLVTCLNKSAWAVQDMININTAICKNEEFGNFYTDAATNEECILSDDEIDLFD